MTMTFVHGPALGDVIYSFPLIRFLGGGDLCLLPHKEHHEKFLTSWSFFERQEYIDSVRIAYRKPSGDVFDIDNFFTNPDFATDDIVTSHFKMARIDPPKAYDPWLVTKRYDGGKIPVLVHDTPRYGGAADYSFLDWVSDGDLYCVGYEEETEMLVRRFGARWIKTATMDDMAAVVNACDVFVGSQSSPLAIAVGLGKNRLVKRASRWNNCNFGHTNEHTLGLDAKKNWEMLLQYYRPTTDPAARRQKCNEDAGGAGRESRS